MMEASRTVFGQSGCFRLREFGIEEGCHFVLSGLWQRRAEEDSCDLLLLY